MKAFGRKRLRTSLVAVFAFIVWGALLASGGANPAQASTTLATFNSQGTYSWTVPTGVTKITFTVYGASGGNVSSSGIPYATGGAGGEAKGSLKVKPGEAFEIVVGGRGGDNNGQTPGAGGFNGGGGSSLAESPDLAGGGGGGGSDVRIGGLGNSCAGGLSCALIDRIIAAGGGGGASQDASGGAGGGVSGVSVSGGGGGGGQEGPLTPPADEAFQGSFGQGGVGNVPFGAFAAGGGGGGWFGGDGGAINLQNSGGGGGSGFISTLAMKSAFPHGTHIGDGLVIITTS